jgi:steroid 5-alpha reductase family enzyme
LLAGLAAILVLFTGLWLVSLLVKNSSTVDTWSA